MLLLPPPPADDDTAAAMIAHLTDRALASRTDGEYRRRIARLRDALERVPGAAAGLSRPPVRGAADQWECMCGSGARTCVACSVRRLRLRLRGSPPAPPGGGGHRDWARFAAAVVEAEEEGAPTPVLSPVLSPASVSMMDLAAEENQPNAYIGSHRVLIYLECIRRWYPAERRRNRLFELDDWAKLTHYGRVDCGPELRRIAHVAEANAGEDCRLIFPYLRGKSDHFVLIVVRPPRPEAAFPGEVHVWDSISELCQDGGVLMRDCVPIAVLQALHSVGMFEPRRTRLRMQRSLQQTENDCAIFMLQHAEVIVRYGTADIPWVTPDAIALADFINPSRAGAPAMRENRTRLCRFTDWVRYRATTATGGGGGSTETADAAIVGAVAPYRGLLISGAVDFHRVYPMKRAREVSGSPGA